LHGPDHTTRLTAPQGEVSPKNVDRWDRWTGKDRVAEVALERDRLLRRMHDLGQFMKTLKEWHSRAYREAHGWEGTLWRERYKSILVSESLDAFRDIALYIALAEMLMYRVHAFSNGLAIGSRNSLGSVPMPGKRITPVAQGDRLCTATCLRGTMFRVA
jgi:hypothetical protein